VNGDLTVAGGTYTATSAPARYPGISSTAGGTFTHNGGTGDSGRHRPDGLRLHHFPTTLTKSVAAADTLTFQAGSTTTVQGTVTLQGAAGQLLRLRSSVAGTALELYPARCGDQGDQLRRTVKGLGRLGLCRAPRSRFSHQFGGQPPQRRLVRRLLHCRRVFPRTPISPAPPPTGRRRQRQEGLANVEPGAGRRRQRAGSSTARYMLPTAPSPLADASAAATSPGAHRHPRRQQHPAPRRLHRGLRPHRPASGPACVTAA